MLTQPPSLVPRGSCRTYETSIPTNAPWHPITSVTFLIHTTLSPWLLTYPPPSSRPD